MPETGWSARGWQDHDGCAASRDGASPGAAYAACGARAVVRRLRRADDHPRREDTQALSGCGMRPVARSLPGSSCTRDPTYSRSATDWSRHRSPHCGPDTHQVALRSIAAGDGRGGRLDKADFRCRSGSDTLDTQSGASVWLPQYSDSKGIMLGEPPGVFQTAHGSHQQLTTAGTAPARGAKRGHMT
jgi:hypothetical protein